MLAMRRLVPFFVALLVAVLTPLAQAQFVITTIPVGQDPVAGAVNSATNKVYVLNKTDRTVTIIDGATNIATAVVPVGNVPLNVVVNSTTNKIYVTNNMDGTVTAIDGATNTPSTITVGNHPKGINLNSLTNTIYVANNGGNSVSVINGATNTVTATIPVGNGPSFPAVNPITNKIYVANSTDSTVSVIDGASNTVINVISTVSGGAGGASVNPQTNRIYVKGPASNIVSVIDANNQNQVSTITLPSIPGALAIDRVTNKIYVGISGGIAVVDGATNNFTTITVPSNGPVADDAVTNKIYVSDSTSSTVTMIDGSMNTILGSAPVGTNPSAMAVNSVTDRIYVLNSGSNNVTVLGGGASNPLRFIPLAPCRITDTRQTHATLQAGVAQTFTIAPACNVPTTAVAYSLNLTVAPVNHGRLGFLTVWPTGLEQPNASTLNSFDGRVKANAAILAAGAGGAINAFASNNTDLIIDVNGYFVPQSTASSLAFYPLPPCRIVDTRVANGLFGSPSLVGHGTPRDFPLLSNTSCPIPATAQAYSLNMTALPKTGRLGYLTVWPADQQQPGVSTLNAPTGTNTANAAIVPGAQKAGNGIAVGDIDVYVTDDSDLLIDINGYFAPPGQGGESLYTLAPCRVLDTRNTIGTFNGELTVDVLGSPCGVPGNADVYVFNATVIPPAKLGFLSLYPDGTTRPTVSTLNALDGAVTNNMAVVPSGNGGQIDAYASAPTNLLLDISSYFAPTTALTIFSSLPLGVVSTPYAGGASAAGGTPPYTWSITAGTLPPGLTLTQTSGFALIQGTPTTPGAFNFTLQVQDSAMATATANLTIAINSLQTFSVKTHELPVGSVGSVYNAPALISQGGTGPYTWSVPSGTGMLPPGLALNSDGTITGSPTTAGTYTFFVEVVDQGNGNAEAFAQLYVIVNSGAANGQISGNYAFSFGGFGHSQHPSFAAGSFVADGRGNITSGSIDINSPNSLQADVAITGSYSINANGVGAMSLSYGNDSIDFGVAVSSNGDVRFIQFLRADLTGGAGAGVISKATKGDFLLSSLSGPFAMGISGFDFSLNRFAAAGVFQLDGAGHLTQGTEDVNDNGTVSSVQFTGTLSSVDASTGRGTMSLTAGQNTYNLVYYVVTKGQLVLMDIDQLSASTQLTSGLALAQSTSDFTNANLNATSVLQLMGTGQSNGQTVANTSAGLLTGDGSGNAKISIDQNQGGTLTRQTLSGQYSVAANGRVTLTNFGTTPPFFYLVNTNQGLVIGTDGSVTSGSFEPQTGSPFSDASFSGTYVGASEAPVVPVAASTVVAATSDGQGNVNVTVTSENNQNLSFKGTYVVDSTGRFPIGGTGGGAVGYVVSPTKDVILTSGSSSSLIVLEH